MNKFLALGAVAAADIARSVWVMDAILDTSRDVAMDPWLICGLVLATGGMSVAMIGLVLRAVFERQHARPGQRLR